MRHLILILTLALLPFSSSAATYKCEAEDGSVEYSDKPCSEADAVELPEITTYEATAPRASGTTGGQDAAVDPAEADVDYTVSISSPSPDQVFSNVGGQIQASVTVTPNLGQDLGVMLYLDGSPVHLTPSPRTSFTLSEVYRGGHSVRATLVDPTGRVVAQSESVAFFVRQRSIANPP